MKTAREVGKTCAFWEFTPDNKLLSGREENKACLTANPGEVQVFFSDAGEVALDLSGNISGFSLKWMNVRKGEWAVEKKLPLAPKTNY